MNELQVINMDGQQTVDSQEVAKMIGVDHKNILKKIREYQQILDGSELSSPQFFIESSYINSQNKKQPCYLLTKKGCEMIANKITGEKGILFTAKYVEAFNDMEKQINAERKKFIKDFSLRCAKTLCLLMTELKSLKKK